MIISKQSKILNENNLHRIFLGLGSNVGDSVDVINQAIYYLRDSEIIDLLNISSFYLTEPWGILSQNWFYNLVIEGQTSYTPFELITFLKTIEHYLGRQARPKWEERELDIDILFYNSSIIKNPKVEIPHPQIENRRFVLVPMDEIAPNFVHPLLNLSIHKILLNCNDQSKVIRKDEV